MTAMVVVIGGTFPLGSTPTSGQRLFIGSDKATQVACTRVVVLTSQSEPPLLTVSARTPNAKDYIIDLSQVGIARALRQLRDHRARGLMPLRARRRGRLVDRPRRRPDRL